MNVVVLAGGYSPERDVSLVSGSKVVKALRSKGHNVLLLDSYKSLDLFDSFQQLYNKYSQDNYDFVIPETEPDLVALKASSGNGQCLLGKNVLEACKLADVVFIGLHGSMGENGQIQAALDLFDICYTGSNYVGCLLSMDKTLAKEIMAGHGIKTPTGETFLMDSLTSDRLHDIFSAKALPFVVKPCSGGSSLGITIVKQSSDISKSIEYVQAYENKILIEQYISGREFTVGVLDNMALPVIEICPKKGFFDYVNKYQSGLTAELCPAPISDELSEQLKEMALKAHQALRLGDYSRSDFIVEENGEIYCLEVNSLPGLTPASLVPKQAKQIGLDYEDLCEKIVMLALNRKNDF